VARGVGAHAELARAQVDLATIRHRRGERGEASALLDQALGELDRLGMAPEADRAASLLGPRTTRGGDRQPSATPAYTVILFSDVVDSTRLTEELGALAYRRLARSVEELVTSTVVAHGGTIVTGISLGDGFIGLFPTVEQAVTAARRCAAEVGDTGLHLHLALHQGEILLDGARIYGGPVNYAARLCALSGPDEILVSSAIRAAAAGIAGVAFVDRGTHELKGIAGAHRVAALVDDTGGDAAPATRRDHD
jgi:class 3 adenylate cyclase